MKQVTQSLAWALEAECGRSAMFGAHVSSSRDLDPLLPLLRNRGIDMVTLDPEASRALVMAMIEGRSDFPDADIIFLTDVLATLSSSLRTQTNLSREAWLSAGRCFVFVESAPGSPEGLRELRDLLAVFRDIFDLRPDVGTDDHLWDTGPAAPLEKLGQHIPTMTKGPTLVIGGRVRHKRQPTRSCPDCGGQLQPAKISIQFELAPTESAIQEVGGYRCSSCEAEWPEPRAMRGAHTRAFGLEHETPRD